MKWEIASTAIAPGSAASQCPLDWALKAPLGFLLPLGDAQSGPSLFDQAR